MLRDTRRLIDPTAGLGDATARVATPGSLLAGLAEAELPPVGRWAPTRLRPGAELRLYVDAGDRRDPLLATWQHELGRVAALPVDFENGAPAWPAWRGFGKLWSQLLLWTMPPARPSDHRLEARRLDDGALVRLETAADAAGPFALRVPGIGEVALHPVGRRAFAAVVPNLAPGVHVCRLVSAAGDEPLRLVVPARSPSGRELRAQGPNLTLLARAAALTGGRLGAEPRDVVGARAGARRRRVPLAPILVPLALVLAGDDDARGEMREADRGVGLVHVLPASAARAVRIDPQVLVADVDLDLLLDVGEDEDRGERGVAAGVGVEGRDADETVNAGFGLHVAVRIRPFDREGGALETRTLTGLELDELDAEAAALAPAEVHAQQHLGPVLRLEPAGAGVDLDDRVAAVVLAAEEAEELELGEAMLDLLDLRGELAERLGRALLGQP